MPIMTKFVFGVDGGQTSTKCALVSADGRVLGLGSGGGLIHLAAEGARARFAQSLGAAMATAWHNAGLTPQPIGAIGLGLTGVEGGSPEAAIVDEVARELTGASHVIVQSDAYAALFGAHAGQPGIIAIAGTGSHILGVNADGALARAGGWGWLLGDEGSALWIGQHGLMAALRAHDCVDQPTALEAMLRHHFNIDDFRSVKRLVYDSGFGARGFAGLAAVVSRAAEQGDEVALQLIHQAARDLARQVRAVQNRLNLPANAPIAPVGGAVEHVHGLHDGFVAALRDGNPIANVVAPQHPPVIGAALLAMRVLQS